jgi:superfamily II DNA helicase RecQ
MFNQFNVEFERTNEADRATAVVLEKQLKVQLKTLEEMSMKLERDVEMLGRSLQKTLRASDELHSSHDAVVTNNIDSLRKWRLKKAKEAGDMPAYTVFSDTTMEHLARAMPRTIEELLRVHGIGPVKAHRFGSKLLEVLRELRKSTRSAAM